MPWSKLLATTASQIEPALLKKLEYVLEENRVYRALLERQEGRLKLTDAERIALAEKAELVSLNPFLDRVMNIVVVCIFRITAEIR